MRIIIQAKNLELTPELRNFVEKKIASLKKFINILKRDTPEGLKSLAEVFVEIEKETHHHKKGKIFLVKIKVDLPGRSLLNIFRSDNLLKAIVGAKNELKLEIQKYKFRIKDKKIKQQRKLKGKINL